MRNKAWSVIIYSVMTSPEKASKMKKVDGLSADVQQEKIAALKQVAPEVFSDGKVDVEQLKKLIGEQSITDDERYRLEWAGKSEVFDEIAERSSCTLTLDEKRSSKDWKQSDNVFIEGENLEVLRTLQKAYHGKVKMIYIDPPYNTGHDFVYNDVFRETEDEYCEDECNVDENGLLKKAYKLNSRDSGRFHSNWLSMMYPRLYLARNLLRDDGVIFVSIDDNEFHNLRQIMNEVFGEENFVGVFLWKKKGTSTNVRGAQVSSQTEYILCFSRSGAESINLRYTSPEDRSYPYNDEEGDYRKAVIEKRSTGAYDRASMKFEILGTKPRDGKRWQIGKEKARELESKNRFILEDGVVKLKIYKHEEGVSASAQPTLLLEHGSTQIGQSEVDNLLGGSFFDTPKPTKLLQHLLTLGAKEDSLVLDFFAGSATLAHAVLKQNAEDGGNRRYVCVQIPEETPEDSEARKAGYSKISDIAIDRIKKAAAQIKKDHPEYKGDLGVRVYKESESHFPQWHTQAFESDKDLEQAVIDYSKAHITGTARDRATEVLLKLGYPLTTPLEEHKGYFTTPDGVVLVLDSILTLQNLMKLLEDKPKTVVVLEKFFKKDEDKINFSLRCKEKGVIFQTV